MNRKNQLMLPVVFTRYSVIFTGKKLPGGEKADGVYLILNDPYWEVLNSAPDRPLDYAYLKALTPAPQRFYELISYRIFAAIKYKHDTAQMPYSEYCMYAAQTRYYDYDRVKKQMYKIHRPHVKSGYVAKAWLEPTLNSAGKPDWDMLYIPGPRALAEYKAFHKKKAVSDDALEQGRGEVDRSEPPDQNARELAQYFHRTFFGLEHGAPSQKEIAQAAGLIAKHGPEKARYVVEFCHKVAPETNFKPQVFGAVLQYADRAIADYENAIAREAAKAAIAACTRCDSNGMVEVTDERGRTMVARCSHAPLPLAAEKPQGLGGQRFRFFRNLETS